MTFAIKDWNIEEMTGYKPKTTFYRDFSIADGFGMVAIKDTLNRALEYAKTSYKIFTELVMALNWKSWEHENNTGLCKLYCDLYYKTESDYFKLYGENVEAMNYYYRTTD